MMMKTVLNLVHAKTDNFYIFSSFSRTVGHFYKRYSLKLVAPPLEGTFLFLLFYPVEKLGHNMSKIRFSTFFDLID